MKRGRSPQCSPFDVIVRVHQIRRGGRERKEGKHAQRDKLGGVDGDLIANNVELSWVIRAVDFHDPFEVLDGRFEDHQTARNVGCIATIARKKHLFPQTPS